MDMISFSLKRRAIGVAQIPPQEHFQLDFRHARIVQLQMTMDGVGRAVVELNNEGNGNPGSGKMLVTACV